MILERIVTFKGLTFTVAMPDREFVDALHVGQIILNTFGKPEPITKIHALTDDIHGKRFACYYQRFDSDTSNLSDSMKEGELQRSCFLANKFTSAELDEIERLARMDSPNTDIGAIMKTDRAQW